MAEIKKYLHTLDIGNNKIINLLLNPLSTADRTTVGGSLTAADQGYVCYDTDEDVQYFWDGSNWVASGGGGTIPNLQQVTDIGSNTTNDIIINNVPFHGNDNFIKIGDGPSVLIEDTTVAIGTNAAGLSTGYDVKAIGYQAALQNTGSAIVAIGDHALDQNTGSFVNALGENAGYNSSTIQGNIFSYVNFFGANTTATADGQTVFSKDGTIMERLGTDLLTASRLHKFPNADGTLALSVNGVFAGTDGSITLSIPTVIPSNVTAASTKITLAGTPTGAALQAFSIDVNEANLSLNNIGGTLGISKGGTNLTALGTANQLIRVNSGATALEYFTPTYLTSAVTAVTATSPITSSGGNTPVISTSMATNKLIGRSTAGVGVMEEISIGTGLSLSAGILTNTISLSGYVPYSTYGTNNVLANNFFDGFTSVVASGTLITLTVNSTPSYLVTGSGGQTIKLPDATTLPNGAVYDFNNNQSSGAILVNNNSNTLVKSIPSGGYLVLTLIDNSIAAGSWDAHFQAPSNVSWSTNTFSYVGSFTGGTWNGSAIGILYGGTGATTAAGARTNLGSTTVGDNFFTLTNPSAITFPRINADNTVSTLNASDFRTAIGAGTSSLASTNIFVGNGSGVATGVALTLDSATGAFALSNAGVLTIPDASASVRGFVNISAQTFAGAKTFNGSITATANGHRFGNFEILTSGNASTTGQGITVTGVDRTVQFQGSSLSNATDMFQFRSYTGTSSTAALTSTSFSVMRVYGGFTDGNIASVSGNTLWLSPTYNFTGTQTGIIARGVYYAPTLTSLTNTTHRAWENTTGDVYLCSTSGNVGIGNVPSATYKLDINGAVRTTGTLAIDAATMITNGATGGCSITTTNNRISIVAGADVRVTNLSSIGTTLVFTNGTSANTGIKFNFNAQFGAVGIASIIGTTSAISTQSTGDARVIDLRPTLTKDAATGVFFRGIYYAPDVTGLTSGFTHRAFENTVGDNVFNSTSGKTGFGLTTITALVHIKAGTATANTAPLKFTSGTNLTVVENGAIEFDGNNFYCTANGTRQNALKGYSGSFSATGTATTAFTVTFGGTQPNSTYQVLITPTNALTAAVLYVTSKTTTTFTVTFLTGLTGTVAFDWLLVQ